MKRKAGSISTSIATAAKRKAGSISTSIATAAKMKREVEPAMYEEELPIDIVYMILLHLPIKTLSRFRCVCKSWSSLISSSLFQQDHDRRSAEERPFLLLIQNCKPRIHLSTYSPNQTIPINNFPTTIPSTRSGGPPLFIESCHGLLCLGSRNNILLCNPSTQELMPLPPLPRIRATRVYPSFGFGYATEEVKVVRFNHSFGFGYAASTQEFKVVSFFCHIFWGRPLEGLQCEVFTLGTTMWRKARRPRFAADCPAAPFVNGAVHLLPKIYQPNKAIAAFNIETETYNYIRLPEYYGDLAISDGLKAKSLSELGGYLCLNLDFVTKIELWFLIGYDNGEWIKSYTIDTTQFSDFPSLEIYRTQALLIMADGNMLMNITRQGCITELVCYDPQSHTVTQRIGSDCLVTFYVESFFPLQTG